MKDFESRTASVLTLRTYVIHKRNVKFSGKPEMLTLINSISNQLCQSHGIEILFHKIDRVE